MKKKKDILFLCQFFYPELVSSAQLPYETALALRQQGFTVDALCGYPKEYTKEQNLPTREQVNGIGIHRLKYIQTARAGFLSRIVNYFSFTLMVLLHLGEIGQYRSVIVYSNPPILPWIASWAKSLLGTKLVFVAYDLYPEMATLTDSLRDKGAIARLMEHINRVVYRRADWVVALSSEMEQFLLEHRPIPASRVQVIPNWYPERQEPPRQDNPFRELVGDRFVVAYFGNMGIMHDMQTVMDAIRLLKDRKDLYFLFAGHGKKLDLVKQTLELERIENASIHSFLPNGAFQDAMDVSSCAMISLVPGGVGLCVPSKTYHNMMQGLPLVAIMDECDIVKDIQEGAGLWVRNGDVQGLADGIRRMADDPALTAEMSRTSRKLYLEKYTLEICTGKYVELFKELLG